MSHSLRLQWTLVCQAPLFMEILQAKILEWVAMPSSRWSSQPGIEPRSPSLQADSFPEPQGKLKNTEMCGLSLLPGTSWARNQTRVSYRHPLQVDSLSAELPRKPICNNVVIIMWTLLKLFEIILYVRKESFLYIIWNLIISLFIINIFKLSAVLIQSCEHFLANCIIWL